MDKREEVAGNAARRNLARTGKATIEQVAKEAGVSLATVSRVVNGTSPYISAATRQRVEEAIERLQYTPNRLIRSLQTGRSDVIAYISLDVGPMGQDEFVITMLHQVCRAASVRNYDVLVPVGSVTENGLPSASALMDGRCDGVIMSGPKTTPLANALVERGFPTVVLWSNQGPHGAGFVTPDNTTGVRRAIEHLISLGHRRIAHLAGPLNTWDCAQWRLEEYVNALQAAGIPADPALIAPRRGTVTWAVDTDAVESALDHWSMLSSPPTAVFCASDRLAIALIGVATSRGIRIPEDLSVVGFDDVPMASHCIPPLTTISVSLDKVAVAAMDLVVDLIAEKQGTHDTRSHRLRTIESCLTVRDSTGPCCDS